MKRFAEQEKSSWDVSVYDKNEKGDTDIVLRDQYWLNVGGLVDAYLAEIASDPNLPLASFTELSGLIPGSARPVHDGLYRAIDIYLKVGFEHC